MTTTTLASRPTLWSPPPAEEPVVAWAVELATRCFVDLTDLQCRLSGVCLAAGSLARVRRRDLEQLKRVLNGVVAFSCERYGPPTWEDDADRSAGHVVLLFLEQFVGHVLGDEPLAAAQSLRMISDVARFRLPDEAGLAELMDPVISLLGSGVAPCAAWDVASRL